jgi:hypothetical protein
LQENQRMVAGFQAAFSRFERQRQLVAMGVHTLVAAKALEADEARALLAAANGRAEMT